MKNTIEVEVPKEILDYQAKVIAGLNLRQFVSGIVLLFTVVPSLLFSVLF